MIKEMKNLTKKDLMELVDLIFEEEDEIDSIIIVEIMDEILKKPENIIDKQNN